MNGDLLLVLALLAGCVGLFVLNRPRMDVVALLAMVALPLTGVLSVQEALAGFSDPSVVLIAALFVIGDGLVRTGVAYRLGDWLMRAAGSSETRLLVLLMLAVAAVPGSIFPQRSVDPVRVRTFVENNPDLAPWLDRFLLFDVFSSPWFASIYLLLMISLVGCITPRMGQHLRSIRAQPPRAPSPCG